MFSKRFGQYAIFVLTAVGVIGTLVALIIKHNIDKTDSKEKKQIEPELKSD